MSETITTPLPCIVCGMQPKPCPTPWQPSGALMFDAGPGHYGCTVWDTMDAYRSLTVNVCDECLVERKARVGVLISRRMEHPDLDFVQWEVDR